MDEQLEIQELMERPPWHTPMAWTHPGDPRKIYRIQDTEGRHRTALHDREWGSTMELGELSQRGVLESMHAAELRGHGELMTATLPYTKGNESYPWNYQWYIQQMAQNNGDRLDSTQKGIREANEFGGAPLGNDILHPSCVDDLPNQRRQGVFDPIREAAIAQGILRNANRWREKLKVPHRQRMVAQQSRAALMCLQRWRKTGQDYPEMLAINPNIAPRTALGGKVRGGYKPYRKIEDRHLFGPYS